MMQSCLEEWVSVLPDSYRGKTPTDWDELHNLYPAPASIQKIVDDSKFVRNLPGCSIYKRFICACDDCLNSLDEVVAYFHDIMDEMDLASKSPAPLSIRLYLAKKLNNMIWTLLRVWSFELFTFMRTMHSMACLLISDQRLQDSPRLNYAKPRKCKKWGSKMGQTSAIDTDSSSFSAMNNSYWKWKTWERRKKKSCLFSFLYHLWCDICILDL